MWLSYLNLAVIIVGVPLALVVAIVASYFVPARYWLRLQAVSATLQGYTISVAGIFPSVSLLAALGAWRSLFAFKEIYRLFWVRWLLALLACQLAAMAWSPEPLLAIRNFIFALPLLTLAAAMYGYAAKNPADAFRILAWTLRVAAVLPLVVIAFRLSPLLEAKFYGFPLARVLISINTLSTLFIDGGNNVIAADKAGGLFINANTASAYLGVCAMLAWGVAKATSDTAMRVLSVLFWVSVFFTGSKAGAIAAVFTPALAWLVNFVRIRRLNVLALLVSCLVAGILVLIMPFVINAYQASGFTEASVSTLQTRELIWSFARRMMSQHLLLGLGYGGWEREFAFYSYARGFRGVMPAHNAFLILWSQAGLMAVITGAGLVLSVARWCWRHIWSLDAQTAALSRAVLWAFFWYVFQAQGENFGLMGEVHLTPLLGMAFGLLAFQTGVPRDARAGIYGSALVGLVAAEHKAVPVSPSRRLL